MAATAGQKKRSIMQTKIVDMDSGIAKKADAAQEPLYSEPPMYRVFPPNSASWRGSYVV